MAGSTKKDPESAPEKPEAEPKKERMFRVCMKRQSLFAAHPASDYQIPDDQPHEVPWDMLEPYRQVVLLRKRRSLEDLHENQDEMGLDIHELAALFVETPAAVAHPQSATRVVLDAIEKYRSA